MSVFEGREYYKPFEYPWAFEAYDQQQKMHWLPSEVPLHEDVNDWNSKMTDAEKNLVKQILTCFTQGDVDIAQAYMDVYIPMFKKPEVRMMLSTIATSEANHAHSYSLLNDTIGMDDRDYRAFQEITAMNDKHEYLWRNKGGTEEEKIALQEKFQADSLELQKQAIQDQISVIEQTLAEGDLLTMLETGILDESTNALAELRNALASVNLEIANAGKDPESGEPKTLADRLGLNEEQVERINKGVAGVEAGLDAMSQLVEARAAERFGKVDQLLQQGVINEEEAERRKEQIKKDAARKQQKIDVTQAVINTAKAVTSALNTQPFLPAGLIMAGIATAQGAAQIKMIRSQKFAKGGILNGPSHAQGGIPMFSKGGAFYGEAEGGEAVLTKGVMANPALASMASAINVAGGGVPFFANGGVLDPIQSATPTDRAADIIASGLKSRQPVLVVEQLRERENSVDVIESLRTIG